MDSNRDESERCIELAKYCIKDNDNEKALKFLLKAERLFPSPEAKGFYYYLYLFLL
jgi:DnaJ family protein B protein 12